MRNVGTFRAGLFALALLYLSCIVAVAGALPVPLGNQPGSQQPDILKNLKFRNIGPAVAGCRVTSVVGVPGKPEIYYVGAAAGGVFKTTNGGMTWKAIFDHEASASIGAIALAPSNPNWVWVGTGEANIRTDVIGGHGVYFSSDGGHSWKFMGLGDVGQISSIIVDPQNPNIVYVGALGHVWAPNVARGVYRTTDGGKTWKKILFVNDSTGVADLVMAPGNPKVLFAAMWTARRYPWYLVDGGKGSGIYRTTDGGNTWKKLTKGLPAGPLGRIALAIAPTNPNHLYALIAAKKGMLWASMDMGNHWTAINDSHALDVRPFYFSKMAVSPVDQNKVYFLSVHLIESDDGGKTLHWADPGVHSDHHAIWIAPKNPARIIQGTDAGVYLSLDGGKTWRYVNNLPIEQFYQVAVSSRAPYSLCGGLQDREAWCCPLSRLGHSHLAPTEISVRGGDGEYAVPAPSDPKIIYADGNNGAISRFDLSTHRSRLIRPYLEGQGDMKPADLKYRFNWTSPIAVSPTNANEVYLGGNVVFKSTDGGQHWKVISPDLTRNDKSKQVTSGGPVEHDNSGAENYDTILSLTLAPTNSKVIWVGTDDGLVQVTRDGGDTWTNVTKNIPGAPQWARVYQIGVSPFDAGTAYVAFDAHMLGDRRPYVYKTSDYGQSWTKITAGLPADCPVYVVREDPNQRNFLVAGTDTGLFFSADDGGNWHPLTGNFPTAPVYDIKFIRKLHDLVVATHGRGLFVLDDIRPLEELNSQVMASEFHLFTPGPGTQFHRWGGSTEDKQEAAYQVPNPPAGVIIDYYLKSAIEATPEQKAKQRTPVKIVITNAKNQVVATMFGPSRAGINRAVWNMRYDGPAPLKDVRPLGVEPHDARGTGPRVLAGTYRIAVTVDNQTERAAAQVFPDTTLGIPAEELHAYTHAVLVARNELTALNEMINRIDRMEAQWRSFRESLQGSSARGEQYASLLPQGRQLAARLQALKDSVYNPGVQHDVEEDGITAIARLHGQLSGLAFGLTSAFRWPPEALLQERMRALAGDLDHRLAVFNALLKTGVASYNKAAYRAGAPTLFGGGPIEVEPAPAL